MDFVILPLKIFMWILIVGFGCNFIMQTISYSFYQRAKPVENQTYPPVKIQFQRTLFGYGYNLDIHSENVMIFFGGSNDIAFNAVSKYAGAYNCPFICADYYGTQESRGKLNLASMQKTAEDVYTWVAKKYPERKIVSMGHSYGCGTAAYLASVKNCSTLILAAAYRDTADLYNKIIPIFFGPAKIFISNNIDIKKYARNTSCKTYIIGSLKDNTLSARLQQKVADYYNNAEVKIFKDVKHEEYFLNNKVIAYVQKIIQSK